MSAQFIVSALKYRPQTFDTVVGQSHITTTLKNAIRTEQVAHSFLFCGPRGVGKTTCARILAKTLNCTNVGVDGEACDKCSNCTTFNNNTSFNVHELDAASNNSVDDIRILTDQVRFAPSGESKYKVYIIDEVHMLTSQAFNAFLKTLEEPPSYAVFILATTEKHKIIPTILSRCQIFDFKRITNNDIVQHLQGICAKESVPAEDDALHFIALKSEGCMRDALSIMDKITSFGGGKITYEGTIDNLNILDYDYYFKFTDSIMLQDTASVMLMLDDVLAKGFEGDSLLLGLAEHMRNLMVCRDEEMRRLLEVTASIRERYREQSTRISPQLMINSLSILSAADAQYKLSRNKRLHVELCLIKLCNLTRAIELITQTDGAVVKKNLISNTIVPLRSKASAPSAASLHIDFAVVPKLAVPKATNVPPPVPEAPRPSSSMAMQEVPAPLVAANPPRLAMGGLRKLMQDAAAQAAEKVQQQKIAVTPEALAEAWQILILELSGGNDFFKTALQKCTCKYENKRIVLCAESSMTKNIIQEHKLRSAQFFKEKFQDDDLALELSVDQTAIENEPVVRTRREVFEELLERYPILREMREKLGLQLDQ
jgi:DNA polymerase III subunit gamma/tau